MAEVTSVMIGVCVLSLVEPRVRGGNLYWMKLTSVLVPSNVVIIGLMPERRVYIFWNDGKMTFLAGFSSPLKAVT